MQWLKRLGGWLGGDDTVLNNPFYYATTWKFWQWREPKSGEQRPLQVFHTTVKRGTTNYDDVLHFHMHYNLLYHAVPGHLTQRKLGERVDFMAEELQEFIEAAKNQDLVGQADALVDLVYVALGTACMLGLPWEELWQVVHDANMRKVRRAEGTGDHHTIVKPQGWVAPEAKLLEVLYDHGYTKNTWCDSNDWDGINAPPVTDRLCRDDEVYKCHPLKNDSGV